MSTQPPEEAIQRSGADTPCEISVIVPAYNEARRLPPMLLDAVDFLEQHFDSYEIIVVDDGSTDDTAAITEKFARLHNPVAVHRLAENKGKGAAVKAGMLRARGTLRLFADADGATPFGELSRLLKAIYAGADVAIGSRAMHSTETSIRTRWYRKYLGRTFNACVNALVLPGIADTQCGFKLFTAEAARELFSRQTAERFSFDVELLFLARRLGFRISEVPINWENVPGSKVNLLLDSADMLRDVIRFRWHHRHVTPRPLPS
jgi:dolichyl-phosphate beta-glucosyltransferase